MMEIIKRYNKWILANWERFEVLSLALILLTAVVLIILFDMMGLT